MAAPVATARGTPGGIALQDGYQTLITLALDTTIEFWEKTVKPPGIDGGDTVETRTMHNTTWETFAPRSLKRMTECTTRVAYDPLMYTEIVSAINRRDTITVRFADGSTVAFYGYVKSFEPADVEEGTQPEADITIQPTNWDHDNNVEAGPTLVEVSGT